MISSVLSELMEYAHADNDKFVVDNISNFHNIVELLSEKGRFNILKSITATDRLADNTELLYHLFSVENDENVFLSVTVKNNFVTVSDIFDSAKADENEIYDLFGITFIGNNNLKRLYLPEYWNGHPLKKDYEEN